MSQSINKTIVDRNPGSKTIVLSVNKIASDFIIKQLINRFFFFVYISADGMTYSFGLFHDEFCNYFKESKAYTAWIVSLLVGVTLCSGKQKINLIILFTKKITIFYFRTNLIIIC